MGFYDWMLAYGLSDSSAKKYRGAIKGSLSNWAKEGHIITNSLDSIKDIEEFNQVSSKVRNLPFFMSRNETGNSMYSNALNRFSDYLYDTIQERDKSEILNDPNIPKTEKLALVQARVGQGKFREDLIKLWRGCCSVSGYKGTSLLIASHIKPWSKSSNLERLDKYNGLLLAPNLDKTFDKGFITFSSGGSVIISKELQDPENIGISTSLQIKDLPKEVEKYMDFHRNNVFNGA